MRNTGNYLVVPVGDRWIVTDGDGNQKAGPFVGKYYAIQIACNLNDGLTASGKERGESKTRPCITSKSPFISEGAHNRMCSTCRSGSNAMGAGGSCGGKTLPRGGRY